MSSYSSLGLKTINLSRDDVMIPFKKWKCCSNCHDFGLQSYYFVSAETRAHKKLVYLYGSAGTSIIVTFSCNLSCLKTSTALLQRSVHSVLLLFSRSEVTMTRSWSLTSLKYYINNGIASFFKKLSSLNKHVM